MPLTHFLVLVLAVMVAGAATLALAFWAKVPLVALGLVTVGFSLVLGTRQWR